MPRPVALSIILFGATLSLYGRANFTTNSVHIVNSPKWLTKERVRGISNRIEGFLEWDIRRVEAIFHGEEASFQKIQHLGKDVLAVTLRKTQKIHLSPRVTQENFERVFGHELAHVIIIQKYKKAIPRWLEEGLANYAANPKKPMFKPLSQVKLPPVRTLTHPFRSSLGAENVYLASTGLMHFIASRCPISELLQLSVGKKLDGYLNTFCNIKDLDTEFKQWLKAQP